MSEENSDCGRFLDLLALHHAGGKSIREASELAGCSERNGYRISGTDDFKRRVSQIRQEMTSQAVGELSSAASQAVATIRELLSSENEASVRLNAAKAILNALGPISELAELRQRLEALEAER